MGELIAVDQSTVSRTVTRVTDAFLRYMNEFIEWPDHRTADENKVKFIAMNGFPNVIGCVNGTQIRNHAPLDQEHEFVNRNNVNCINLCTSIKYHPTNNYCLTMRWPISDSSAGATDANNAQTEVCVHAASS